MIEPIQVSAVSVRLDVKAGSFLRSGRAVHMEKEKESFKNIKSCIPTLSIIVYQQHSNSDMYQEQEHPCLLHEKSGN